MISIGNCATLACLWEALAPKPGNVHRGADFEDLTFADFATSAAVVGPIVERASLSGVGQTVRDAVEATQQAVGTNTNLGILLLITPLAAADRDVSLRDGIKLVLKGLDSIDTREVYSAIRTAQAGGLGKVEEADVNEPPPEINLDEAMGLAAERDLIARQYINGFEQVFQTADKIAAAYDSNVSLSDSIVRGYLELLAEHADSLIQRKCGETFAKEVSLRAAQVLSSGNYQEELAEFDFYLRSDGHRRNPGTSADFVAAGLFVLLREQRIQWPMKFY